MSKRVREAPAHFLRKGKHYLLTSGTTGYLPNPSEAAVGDTWHGPFYVLGDTHPEDTSRTSYHSQISSVFKVPGKKDLYIACADRWMPDLMAIKYEAYRDLFINLFNGIDADFSSLTKDLGINFNRAIRNTSIADYVWLPLRFAEPDAEHPSGQVYIDWLDEWRIEDYE